jgi:hypothetical protein
MFELLRLKNKKDNEIRRCLNEIEKLVFNMKIKDNPVLKRMKKEDWIVGIHDKARLCWANKYTLDIVRACLLGELQELAGKSLTESKE